MTHRRLSSEVFIDTDVMINVSIGGMSLSSECRNLVEQLMASGDDVFYSQLLRIEYLQALRNLATRQQLPRPLYEQFELHRWGEPEIRENWFKSGAAELDRYLIELPGAVELPVSGEIIRQAQHLMARYALRSLDACHLATAIHYEIPVFWTCDSHFERVDEIAVEVIREDN